MEELARGGEGVHVHEGGRGRWRWEGDYALTHRSGGPGA